MSKRILSCVTAAFMGILISGVNASAAGAPNAEKVGWKLGSQAWTFRRFTTMETIDKLSELGLKYIEIYPGQKLGGGFDDKVGPGMSAEGTAALKAKLAEKEMTFIAYGVVGLGTGERAREYFKWAKDMGVKILCSEPAQQDLPMLDKLCQEYDISVALHNHPKPSRYWNPQTVLAATKGLSPRIGACADTGHWVRSGLDPMESIRLLKGRIICLHFKDLSVRDRKAHDVPWGTGASDAAGQLAELRQQGFEGYFSIEYEAKWTMDELAKCVAFFDAQCAKLAAVQPAGK